MAFPSELYVNPPDHAEVLCVNEKSQIQPSTRTAPLHVQPGQAEQLTLAHGYRRHGTAWLFAALDVKTGTVIAETHCQPPGRRVLHVHRPR